MQTSGVFDSTYTPPRSLGSLPSNSNPTCQLFGWGSEDSTPRRESVLVYSAQSQLCDHPNLFCSMLTTPSASVCSANLGSPVVCSLDAIDGLLINENSCESHNDVFLLSYISIGDDKSWITCAISDDATCVTSTSTTVATTTDSAGEAVKTSTTLIVPTVLSAIFIKLTKM